MLAAFKFNFDHDPDAGQRATKVLVPAMAEQKSGYEGGSVTVLRPDGTEAPFSPVYGKGIVGPWAASVDGNDNVWISNFSLRVGRNRRVVWLPHRTLPAGREDG